MAEITTETMPAAIEPSVDEQPQEQPAIAKLLSFVDHKNIAEELDSNVVGSIGQTVLREFDIDKNSRAEWEKQNKSAMDLAMQVLETKNWPWERAANVKFPLLTTAAIQFQARAYPALVPGRDIAKAVVVGADPDGRKADRADRVGKHLSYQLCEQIENWEEDTDRLLVILPLEGCAFRKTYFDPKLGRSCSQLVRALDFVVNYKAVSLETAPRATHVFTLYPHEIQERQRAGVYLDLELGPAGGGNSDVDEPHEILEQHRLWDLDGDGYPEPYIVTVHKQTARVLRIVARFDLDGIETQRGSIGDILKAVAGKAQSMAMDPRQAIEQVMPLVAQEKIYCIKPVPYFTKYPFIPNPDSAIYDLGFGTLLNPINETVNTVLNQLLDAGTLANTGGGFIGSGIRMKAGVMKFAPGEYKKVDSSGANLKENVVPLQFPGPSTVLFQLLGLLIDAGRDIASVKDIMTGEQPNANVPATTTLALIEQGMKVFTAIYKRAHRSLKAELNKLYRLNRLYLKQEEYFRVLDGDPQKVTIADYNDQDIDVIPYSDPSISTDAQRLARAQAGLQFIGHPLSNSQEIMLRYYRAIGEEEPEALFAPPPSGPSPEQLERMIALKIEQDESHARILKMWAESIASLAKAEAAELGQQMGLYVQYMEVMNKQQGAMSANGRGVPGMASHPGNGGGNALPPGLSAASAGLEQGQLPQGDAGLVGA